MRASSPCQKAGKSGTTGATACATAKDQQFTSQVRQAFSPMSLSFGGQASKCNILSDLRFCCQASRSPERVRTPEVSTRQTRVSAPQDLYHQWVTFDVAKTK